MDGAAFYDMTVPVLLHYLGRLDGIVAKAREVDLDRRLAEDGFTAGVQFRTAQNFALRAVYPPLGIIAPKFNGIGQSKAILTARSAEVRAHFSALSPSDFDGAAERNVTHTAGQGERKQTGLDYVTLFALPNFFFHLTSGYATLRAAGTALGKADFDGIHHYPPGFRF